jgi:hypothetical protein
MFSSRVIIGCTQTDLQDDRLKVLPYVSLIVLEIWYERELEALGKMSRHRQVRRVPSKRVAVGLSATVMSKCMFGRRMLRTDPISRVDADADADTNANVNATINTNANTNVNTNVNGDINTSVNVNTNTNINVNVCHLFLMFACYSRHVTRRHSRERPPWRSLRRHLSTSPQGSTFTSPVGAYYNRLIVCIYFIRYYTITLRPSLLGVEKAPGKTGSMYTCEDISGSNVEGRARVYRCNNR